MRKVFSTLIMVSAMLWGNYVHAHDPPPNFGRWVVDNGNLLSKVENAELTDKLLQIQRETGGRGKGAQVAILTVRSLRGDDIKDFALRTARAWKLGQKGAGTDGKSNGVLILVVKDTAQVRIEVGNGLEGAIPDAKVAQILSDHFTKGASKTMGQALNGAVNDIAKLIYQEANVQSPPEQSKPLPTHVPRSHEQVHMNGDGRLIPFGLTILLSGVFGAVFHRRKRMLRYWPGGVAGGASWASVGAFYALTAPVIAAIAAAGYIVGYILSAFFRHGGDGWLFDPFPRYYGVGPGSTSSEGLRGGGGNFAGGGADDGVDPGLLDGLGNTLANAPSDCPIDSCPLDGCDPGGC